MAGIETVNALADALRARGVAQVTFHPTGEVASMTMSSAPAEAPAAEPMKAEAPLIETDDARRDRERAQDEAVMYAAAAR